MIRQPLKKFRSLLILAVLATGIYFYRVPLAEWLRLYWDREALVAYLQMLEGWGLALISVLILVQLFIAVIPGHLLVVVSGYIYGAPLTIATVSISGILGSQLAFLLARKYGRSLIYSLASPPAIEKWDRIAGERGPLFYLFMFVLPFVPSDMMCYVAGLGRISPKQFFIANFIGRLWSTTATALLGAYGLQPPLWLWVVFLISMAGLYIGWRIYDRATHPPAGET